jgi:hypothetical protein
MTKKRRQRRIVFHLASGIERCIVTYNVATNIPVYMTECRQEAYPDTIILCRTIYRNIGGLGNGREKIR